MNTIDTGFGLTIKINNKNNNIEIHNQLRNTTTIITPLKSVIEL